MDKDYDVYKELVAQAATTTTTVTNSKDLMHERKPLDFTENNLGSESDPSTWALI